MNILVVAFSMRPRPDGDFIRFQNIFPRLAERHTLHLCYLDRHGKRSFLDAYRRGFESVHVLPYAQRRSMLGGLWSHLLFAPDCALRWRDRETFQRVRAAIEELVEALQIDLVHCWEPCADQFMNPKGVPVLFDMCDASSLELRRSLAQRWSLGEFLRYLRLRRFESKIVERFACTFVTDADAAYFGRPQWVRVVPNGVEVSESDGDAYEADDVIAFSGNMSFQPNIDAVQYFYTEIWPLVLASRPNVRWHIIGTEPAPEVLALASHPNVVVTGHVEDIRAHLQRASVVVCPMVTGTGIKNKVLEAMALGRPVVTTPFGTQGISITPGVQLSVEMSAEGFAARVIELLGSPELRQTMGHAARDFVARHHSWAGVTDAIDGLYQVLVGNSHGRHAA